MLRWIISFLLYNSQTGTNIFTDGESNLLILPIILFTLALLWSCLTSSKMHRAFLYHFPISRLLQKLDLFHPILSWSLLFHPVLFLETVVGSLTLLHYLTFFLCVTSHPNTTKPLNAKVKCYTSYSGTQHKGYSVTNHSKTTLWGGWCFWRGFPLPISEYLGWILSYSLWLSFLGGSG